MNIVFTYPNVSTYPDTSVFIWYQAVWISEEALYYLSHQLVSCSYYNVITH